MAQAPLIYASIKHVEFCYERVCFVIFEAVLDIGRFLSVEDVDNRQMIRWVLFLFWAGQCENEFQSTAVSVAHCDTPSHVVD